MNERRALVGYTGFVGQTLQRQSEFDAFFNSQNASEMKGQTFSEVYFSAAKAEKWRANADPQSDQAHIDELIELIDGFSAERFVLISTVDVYENPFGVDEDAKLGPSDKFHAYGSNRLRLENAVRSRSGLSHIVRLPALFGEGLKKNAIFDLGVGNQIDRINPAGEFQFYDMDNLSRDIDQIKKRELPLVNICTEPIRIGTIATEIFDIDIERNNAQNPPKYDIRSKYAELWGGRDYLYNREQVLNALLKFHRSTNLGRTEQ